MEYKRHFLKILLVLITLFPFARGKEVEVAEIETGDKSGKLFLIAGGAGAATACVLVGVVGGKLYFCKNLEEKLAKLAVEKDKLEGLLDNSEKGKELNNLTEKLNELAAEKEELVRNCELAQEGKFYMDQKYGKEMVKNASLRELLTKLENKKKDLKEKNLDMTQEIAVLRNENNRLKNTNCEI